jgi:hypothetical protein
MSDAFRMHVPFQAAYRTMAPEVASRYAELLGGTPADAAAFAAAVGAAIERLGAGAGADAVVDLDFRATSASVHVDIACHGRHETVHVPIPPAAS